MATRRAKLLALLGVVALGIVVLVAGRGRRQPRRSPSAAPAGATASSGRPGSFAARAEKGTGVVEGVVLDPGGAVVAGAQVLLAREPEGPEDEGDLEPVAATADSGGRFRFGELAAGTYLVTAAPVRPGLAPAASGDLALAAGQRRTIELRLGSRGVALRGRVLDSGGGPLPGARVTAVALKRGPEGRLELLALLRATTDQAGAYLLGLGVGEHALQVEADGYASRQAQVTLEADTTQDFRLDPLATISGRVLERAGGQAVAGAEVSASLVGRITFHRTRAAAMRDRQAAISDGAGAFRITGLSPGEYTLEARQGALVGTSVPVRVVPAQTVDGVTIFCDPSFSVTGRVVQRDGKAPQRAAVFARSAKLVGSSPSAEVQPDGGFHLEGLVPGRYELSVAGLESGSATKEVQITDRDLTGVVIESGDEHVVSGVVVDPQGHPFAGARVTLQVSADRRTSNIGGISDREGRFRIGTAETGAVTLHAHAPAMGFARWGPQPLAAALATAITLKLQPGASASGEVRFDDGRAVAGATVRAMQMVAGAAVEVSGEAGADGRYLLRGLEAGFVELEASPPHRLGAGASEPTELRLGAGEQKTVNLVLPTARPLRGRVLLPDGRPAAGARVTAGASRHGVRADSPAATTEDDGTFVIEELEPAVSYEVRAELAGYADARAEEVSARQAGLVLRLSPASSLAGVVVDAGGKPLTEFEVWALPLPSGQPSGRSPQIAKVHDPQGAFTLRALPPGQYELRAFAPDRHMGRLTVAVAAGQHKRDLRIAIQAGIKVRGRLVDHESGGPLARVRVRAGGIASDDDVESKDDGSFALDDVPVLDRLTLSFSLEGRGYALEPEPVVVPPGATSVDVGTLRFLKGDLTRKLEGGPPGLIGISYDVKDGTPVVTQVLPGMPAEPAGLRPGDRLLAVDGTPLARLSQGARSYLLKGKPGTEVTITVQSGAQPRTVTLTRRAMPAVTPR